ncbi:serine/threonine-protein kinase, partial [Arthrobacter sp. SO5]|uniref:serine/threonine-protein kinase n=1 Tax=Arthrobacter sp. SO5 TaxID=1897055 RepID=UPI001E457BA6
MEHDALAPGGAPKVPGYDVERCLGRGGSATVWLVVEESTGREYALKCFDDRAGADGPPADQRETEEGMRREVRILSALDHGHLIRAHAVLRLRPPHDGGEDGLGLVLDYAPGGSLGGLLASRGQLGPGETVTVLTPVAQALAYLHGHGFTHGDVSPGNVLFSAHGKPLLADLGVARMVADTSPVAGAGTEGFRDPAPVDAVRAGLQPERDVYSLAALGWYCLTGRAPEPGAQRPPLPLLVAGVPAALAEALEAGLNDDRRRRPSAAEFAAAVYRSAEPEPVDLSVSVHPTVIPRLLTRRALPRTARQRRAERLRGFLGRNRAPRPDVPPAGKTRAAARHSTNGNGSPAQPASGRPARPGRRTARLGVSTARSTARGGGVLRAMSAALVLAVLAGA